MLPAPKSQTLAELQAAIAPTKRDALIILNGSDKVADEPIRKYRKDGQIESETQTVRDVETGAVVSGKQITWTYYENEKGAPVNTITIVETDAAGNEVSRKIIQHFPDERQPIFQEENMAKPIEIEMKSSEVRDVVIQPMTQVSPVPSIPLMSQWTWDHVVQPIARLFKRQK